MQPSYRSIEDGTELKPRESMELCVAILKLGGLWHTRDKSHKDLILYNVRRTFVLLVYYTLAFSVYVYLFVAWESFSDMIETISYIITLTLFAFKIYVMIIRGDEVQHIVKTVQENFFIHETELSIENRKIIKNTISQARKMTIAYVTIYALAIVVFLLSPLISFDAILQTHNATNISSETLVYDRKLPLQLWTPLDVTRSPQFEIAYTYVAISISINAVNITGIDVFCITTFLYLTGQFELLCDSLRNASERVEYRLHERTHSSTCNDRINKHLDLTSDKTAIRLSKANTDSVVSAKGKVYIIYMTQKPPYNVTSTQIFLICFVKISCIKATYKISFGPQ
jgi:hypothetical protein